VNPRARPAVGAVRSHPLFWSSATVASALDALDFRKPQEAALERALDAAGLRDAYTRLAAWRSAAHPALLALLQRRRHNPGKLYADGFAQLLRFARNALVHPPAAAEAEGMRLLPRPLPPDASAEEREAAVVEALMEHFLERWPDLALAIHVCAASAQLD
jgi:hypothetical protein